MYQFGHLLIVGVAGYFIGRKIEAKKAPPASAPPSLKVIPGGATSTITTIPPAQSAAEPAATTEPAAAAESAAATEAAATTEPAAVAESAAATEPTSDAAAEAASEPVAETEPQPDPSYPIEEIEGIGETYGKALRAMGINNTAKLLAHCSTPTERDDLSERVGVGGTELLDWCNMADIMRVRGIGQEYAHLLNACGVSTTKQLRRRNPANLRMKMEEVNETAIDSVRVDRMPPETVVGRWVAQAKKLKSVLFY